MTDRINAVVQDAGCRMQDAGYSQLESGSSWFESSTMSDHCANRRAAPSSVIAQLGNGCANIFSSCAIFKSLHVIAISMNSFTPFALPAKRSW